MKIEIIGGDPATQKAVADKLAGRGFKADTTVAPHAPWHASFREPYRSFVVEDDRGNTICHGPTGCPTERDEATARLIAAAPELLAALKLLVESPEIHSADMSHARAAIAKAGGAK